MTNREIALTYLRCFCAGDIDRLESLLTPELCFSGTFHTFHSAAEYTDSLRRDPPEPCGYNVLSITENSDEVAIFYEYEKATGSLPIAQLFKFRNNKICEILLVFDGVLARR